MAAIRKRSRSESRPLNGSLILTAFGASAAAGAATGLGALPLLAIPRERVAHLEKAFLGFAAGVMLAASFFSLIIPGLEQAEAGGASRTGAAGIVVAAILLGAAALHALKEWTPPLEELVLNPARVPAERLQRIWLFVAAIVLHNLPEGLAVGVSFGGGNIANGTVTAIGIGLQNIPEGLAVGLLMLSLGYRRSTAFLIALASGLVEPAAGLVGITVVTVSMALLPWGLGFAAGAMIYVVTADVIPETHHHGQTGRANAGLMIGLGAMLFLDVTLG